MPVSLHDLAIRADAEATRLQNQYQKGYSEAQNLLRECAKILRESLTDNQ